MTTWRDVAGYEGKYQVSDDGQVRALNFWRTGRAQILKQKRKKPTVRGTGGGYRSVNLSLNGKGRMFLVHRLVALAFIPNPENKPEVNHRFGDVEDNRVGMLEWATSKENHDHRFGFLKHSSTNRGRFGPANGLSKNYEIVAPDGRISYVTGLQQFADENGLHVSALYFVVSGKRRHHKGYTVRRLPKI